MLANFSRIQCINVNNSGLTKHFIHTNHRIILTGLNSSLKKWKPVTENKASMIFSTKDKPGALQTALAYFAKNNINLTHLTSKPSADVANRGGYDFTVSFEGSEDDDNVKSLLNDIKKSPLILQVELQQPEVVKWFPSKPNEVDLFAHLTLDAGAELQSDHPGFNDPVYRKRRAELANIALNFKHGDKIPAVDYSNDEIQTWSTIYNKLLPLQQQHACREHLNIIDDMKKVGLLANDRIPQLNDVSSYLQSRTGFTLRPVSGLFSPRHFFYALAFRIFCSTQYLRHHSKPLYTPEPDIVHELLGHAPLLANQEFADFSQTIGLAAIGATDHQITQIARCYWFTVEFGLCLQDGQRKAFGAGLLSSFGELEYAMTDEPQVHPWDPSIASQTDYPITTYQPQYFQAENFEDAKQHMIAFSSELHKPFNTTYDIQSNTISVDRALACEIDDIPA